jgi:hypothetical protein
MPHLPLPSIRFQGFLRPWRPPGDLVQQFWVQVARHGGHANILEGLFLEHAPVTRRRRGPKETMPLEWLIRVVVRRITGSLSSSDRSKAYGRHFLGFGHRGGLQDGQTAEFSVPARVLLVLAGEHEGVVGGNQHQGAVYPV